MMDGRECRSRVSKFGPATEKEDVNKGTRESVDPSTSRSTSPLNSQSVSR